MRSVRRMFRLPLAALIGLVLAGSVVPRAVHAVAPPPPVGEDPGEAWLKAHLAARQAAFLAGREARSDPRYDLAWCSLDLAPDLVTGALAAAVTLCARSLEEGLGDLCFDLHDNLAVSAVDGAVSFNHAGNVLT